MSVYLGQDKVGVSYRPFTSVYVDVMSEGESDYYSNWTRPTGWPNLDSMNLQMTGDQDFIYLSYRTGTPDCVCSFHIDTVSGSATVQLGFVANGKFTAQTTETAANNTNKTYWFDNVIGGYAPGYKVVKITGQIKRFYLINVTRPSANGGGTIIYYQQPLIERIMFIPHMTMFTSSYSTHGCGTYSLEHDTVANGTGTALTSLNYAWYPCYNLQKLDISGFYTPNVTNMACAFEYCQKLEHLDMRHWDTSKVTTFTYMFDCCFRLQELDLSSWNTDKCTNYTYMFANCRSLRYIHGLKNFNTSNTTSLAAVFNSCYSLRDVSEVKNWNVSKVTSLATTFASCFSIKEINLRSWDVSKVNTLSSTFYNCYCLAELYAPVVKTAAVTSTYRTFSQCRSLSSIDLSWINSTSANTSMREMFYNCTAVKELNFPQGWSVSGCIGDATFYQVFYGCNRLKRITGVSDWDLSGYNYTMSYSFSYDYCLEEVDLANWNPNPTKIYQAFLYCHSLKELDLSTWGWQNITGDGLHQTFLGCYSLEHVGDISNLGANGKLTTLYQSFADCHSLLELSDLSNWDVSHVTTAVGAFSGCTSLKKLVAKNWNLAACTAITQMFRYCYNMVELDLEGWSIPKVTSTSPDYIFGELKSLQKFGGLPIVLNHRYTGCWSLPEDQWVQIFNQLPTVSSKTLYMSTSNINRLTTAEKAIATGKGWTLAD